MGDVVPAARVAIGLGSNLADRTAHLRAACGELRRVLEDVSTSSVYETDPVHLEDQPAFLNAVVTGRTRLTPRQLLAELQDIERRVGRRRDGPRYGPRVIDLDLLLHDDVVLHEPHLVVPHARLRERAFVLAPLVEIAADWRVPGDRSVPAATVRELAGAVGAVSAAGVRRTEIDLEET